MKSQFAFGSLPQAYRHTDRLCYFHQEIIYLDYMCIIGINLGNNKSRSASHDKVTMYKISYVNSQIIFKNICKFQLINAQIRIASLPPSPQNQHSIHMCCEFICKLTDILIGCVIFIRRLYIWIICV